MKCEFCSEERAACVAMSEKRTVRACARCATLCPNILTIENNLDDAREIMIGQHQHEPRRKLLELKNHSVTVFFSDTLDVVALEIESRRDGRLVKWRREGVAKEFVIRNIGRAYANRDELIPCADFDVARFKSDLDVSRDNLQPRFIAATMACLDTLMIVPSSDSAA